MEIRGNSNPYDDVKTGKKPNFASITLDWAIKNRFIGKVTHVNVTKMYRLIRSKRSDNTDPANVIIVTMADTSLSMGGIFSWIS